ncbi:MAG: hypothetical protein U0871_29615 [Gemmataceae bacterium]
MTALPALLGPTGKPLPLERLLAEGGEGAVFTLASDPAHLVKVYKRPRSPQEIEKLTAMPGLAKANPRLLELTAWPTTVVSHARTRQAAGFLMPRFGDCQPIQQLYNPVQRLRFFPRAGWRFQLRAAANLAAAFDEVHKAGCLVGDVNQSNALVTPDALVRLIDCDSFQVRANGKQYPCEVGVPHYTPPELQGKPLRGLVRTENHDRFGLAVLIYQLLFVGRHPYAGVYRGAGDPSFDQHIAEYRFAQGPLAHSWEMEPPRHTPHLADVPPELAILFRRAFERGGETGNRPVPADWLPALKRLEAELAACGADPGHTYWRGAGRCVWCRLAEGGGPEYYFGVAEDARPFAVDESRLRAVLDRLDAARIVAFPGVRPVPSPATRRALPVELDGLRARWETAVLARDQAVREGQSAEAAEYRRAEDRERLAVERLLGQFRKRDADLGAEFSAAREAVRAERQRRRAGAYVLAAVTLAGVLAMPVGFYHRGYAAIGGLTAVTFGLCLTAYLVLPSLSPAGRRVAAIHEQIRRARAQTDQLIRAVRAETLRAKQAAEAASRELRRQHDQSVAQAERAYRRRLADEEADRRERHRAAGQAVRANEAARADAIAAYRREHQAASDAVLARVSDCRRLAAEYEAEVKRLTVGAEAAARLRHLRLYLITDAVIPGVGAVRKQGAWRRPGFAPRRTSIRSPSAGSRGSGRRPRTPCSGGGTRCWRSSGSTRPRPSRRPSGVRWCPTTPRGRTSYWRMRTSTWPASAAWPRPVGRRWTAWRRS